MSGPLGLVVCGAPLASRADEVATALVADGWSVSVNLTAAGTEWIEPETVTAAAEVAVRTRTRHPSEPRGSRPEQVVAFPLTFNTANKLAHGTMDNAVTGALCDALAVGTPILAILMVNNRLWGHPVWDSTLRVLADAGMRFLDPHTGAVGGPVAVQSGTGDDVVRDFDPSWVVTALAR